jgi:hypothetical protein
VAGTSRQTNTSTIGEVSHAMPIATQLFDDPKCIPLLCGSRDFHAMISQIMKSRNDLKSGDADGALGDLLDSDFKFKKLDIDLDQFLANQTSSFSQIPLQNAINRVDNGSLIIGELCKIFQVSICHIF